MTTPQDARSTALIVAGPTCSGKSALALAIAEQVGGTIVNADSMQVYRELRIVTARPTPAEEARVPHRLYGIRSAAEAGSVAWWRREALAAMEEAHAAGRLPILCGGTGLYLTSLTSGLADIPDPGEAARAEARHLLAEQGSVALHAALAAADPETAARLRPSDSQRVARAWEVWRGTGQGLSAWQRVPGAVSPWRMRAILLDPPRPALRPAIARRFASMIADGAVEEVASLLALRLDPALPAMRAHGVPEIAAHLRGELTLDVTKEAAIQATHRYTKRQATWFRHRRMADAAGTHTINAKFEHLQQFSEQDKARIAQFVLDRG